ncbi:hypothetical protein CI109_105913 [Kwoniella shandongensis]|uniref:Uncharacterized protein n=1 Tax=Kwoniella shandongensis TaxID=1734106 RepID=A0A5M6BQJ1_9TREE|nr:uncharacterized protein CI109_006657 [Kwoniella shandongensis]KAA5525017.1 hypothetical protein CI109_006657 [Kwoniella shandongensis]
MPSLTSSSSLFTPPPGSAPMSNSASKGSSHSLFAEDYSLSGPTSPASGPGSPAPSPRPNGRSQSQALNREHNKSIDLVFPTQRVDVEELTNNLDNLLTPPASPRKADHYTPPPPSVLKNKVSFNRNAIEEEVYKPVPSSSYVPKAHASHGKKGYHTYELCMEGALGHDTKAASYKVGTEKAYHHLNRANELFNSAVIFRPSDKKAMLGRAKVLLQLASDYQPPRVATLSLRDATSLLRALVFLAPASLTARETLAQACALLSNTLHETDDTVEDTAKVWNGEIGELAREALQVLEDVAADKMDKMRELNSNDAAEQSPAMAEMFLALSSAALTVSNLALDLSNVDLHIELAEQALDQASNMATVAAAARVKSSTSSANLITRVQLASGRSSLERLRHTFALGIELDEDDFRALLEDMSMLATECRERAAKLKGHKAAAAATLAWEAIKQFGDAKTLYANLLRLVWRQRKPRRKSGQKNAGGHMRDASGRKHSTNSRHGSLEGTIREEDEDEEAIAKAAATSGRRESASSTGSGKQPDNRKGSGLEAMPEGVEVSSFENHRSRFSRGSIAVPNTGRRGSWLPAPSEGSLSRARRRSSIAPSSVGGSHGGSFDENGGPPPVSRMRRLSSMGGPLTLPDGVSAWNRKASVISISSEDEASGLVPSSELAKTAWQLLEASIKQYKLALSVITGSDMPNAQLARAKNETLTAVAYSSLFMASLSARVIIAAEKRTSLLVTAEVYSTWAAREVGWSFLIEGTQAAQLADRRTNSWRADEAGKRAVMLLVRVWWHRAVTTEVMDVDTKTAAKDAVETVVKRMKDKEGVREGDVARMRFWLNTMEGEMDTAEALFWRSVSRILRGGGGFVMA